MYVVIIGDMINSKKYAPPIRKQVQIQLEKVLEEVNLKFAVDIISNFIITTGDEFQAILSVSASFVTIIEYIRNGVFYNDSNDKKRYVSMRFGVGYGEIHTDEKKIERAYSTGNDGQVFWNARRAIEYVHAENDYGMTNIYFDSTMMENSKVTRKQCNDQMINHLLRLHELMRSNWTTSQKEYVASVSMLLLNAMEQPSNMFIAEKLEMSPQYVSNRMKQTGFYQFVDNIAIIEQLVIESGEISDK